MRTVVITLLDNECGSRGGAAARLERAARLEGVAALAFTLCRDPFLAKHYRLLAELQRRRARRSGYNVGRGAAYRFSVVTELRARAGGRRFRPPLLNVITVVSLKS